MDATTISLIVVGVLISASIALWVVWAFLERSKPTRIRKARHEQELSKNDEAHNMVTATRSIMNVMKRKGGDVSSAEILIKRAELALDTGSHVKAKRLAEEAREELDRVKTMPVAPVKVEKEEIEDPVDLVRDREIQKELIESRERIERLPDNYLESKFEIDIARELCDREGTPEARRLLAMAADCYDDREYTSALKYAIRCKKAIDEEEAGLLSAQKIGQKGSVVEEVRELKIREDKSVEKCPDCGNIVDRTDTFCNMCGEKLSFRINCPGCGVEVSDEQKFCAKCGTELTLSAYECPECGAEIEEDSKFCPECGVEFSE